MISVANSSSLNSKSFINGYDFESLSVSIKPKSAPISIRQSKSIFNQESFPRLKIEFADFDYKFDFEIIDIKGEISESEIILYLKLDDNILKAILSGNRKANEGLYINNFGFKVQAQGETPISVFLLKTLWIMLGLSKQIKISIPVFNQKATISYETNLNEISELLQIRQLAYRLMVIEKAFKIKLPFPRFIDGIEVENIAFCYHSAIDRKFKWFCPPAIVPWFATSMYLSLLPDKNVPFSMQYGPEPFEKTIFGYSINLGLQLAKIEAYVIDNFDEVKKKLSKLDESEVLVQAHSKSGVMQIESITTPTLPKNAFSKDTQKLVDLDKVFDSKYFDKYLNSFSNAFENLTEEQSQAITERPTLEDNAFNF